MSAELEPGRVEEILRELEQLREPDLDPQLDAVRTALTLEAILGITLTDDEIDPAVLGDAASVTELVARRGRGEP